MNTPAKILSTALVLALMLSACAAPGLTADEAVKQTGEVVSTVMAAIAATDQAIRVQATPSPLATATAEPTNTALPTATNTSTATFTPTATATHTATATATNTPTFTPTSTEVPTLTLVPTSTMTPIPTPVIPLVNVSVPTNCRFGPGPTYSVVTVLPVGHYAAIYGRNADSTWWFIPNPETNVGYCWVWTGNAQLTGSLANVPVIAAPIPAPTATLAPTQVAPLPLIKVTVPTNCRSGPGPDYPIASYLPVNQMMNIYGRNKASTWWLIPDPVTGEGYCWVWGGYALISGSVSGVPIVTAPPPPTSTTTPAPPMPLIQVTVATNCRSGPGPSYPQLTYLPVGEYATIYGRNAASTWWLIPNPATGTGYCWIWGGYALINGSVSGVPVIEPPPAPTSTPVAGFTVNYTGFRNCGGDWWVQLDVKNTGDFTLRSMQVTVKDTVTTTAHTVTADGFTSYPACATTVNETIIALDDTVTVSGPDFGYDFGGHKLRATVEVCSKTGLKGACTTQVITFTP